MKWLSFDALFDAFQILFYTVCFGVTYFTNGFYGVLALGGYTLGVIFIAWVYKQKGLK